MTAPAAVLDSMTRMSDLDDAIKRNAGEQAERAASENVLAAERKAWVAQRCREYRDLTSDVLKRANTLGPGVSVTLAAEFSSERLSPGRVLGKPRPPRGSGALYGRYISECQAWRFSFNPQEDERRGIIYDTVFIATDGSAVFKIVDILRTFTLGRGLGRRHHNANSISACVNLVTEEELHLGRLPEPSHLADIVAKRLTGTYPPG